MFKKNPNRPPITVDLKRVPGGFKVTPNDSQALFTVKRIIRTMYRRTPPLIQPISSPKAPLSASNRTDFPFRAPSSNHPHTSPSPPSPVGSPPKKYTKSSNRPSLNFSIQNFNKAPSPSAPATPNSTNTTATQ